MDIAQSLKEDHVIVCCVVMCLEDKWKREKSSSGSTDFINNLVFYVGETTDMF